MATAGGMERLGALADRLDSATHIAAFGFALVLGTVADIKDELRRALAQQQPQQQPQQQAGAGQARQEEAAQVGVGRAEGGVLCCAMRAVICWAPTTSPGKDAHAPQRWPMPRAPLPPHPPTLQAGPSQPRPGHGQPDKPGGSQPDGTPAHADAAQAPIEAAAGRGGGPVAEEPACPQAHPRHPSPAGGNGVPDSDEDMGGPDAGGAYSEEEGGEEEGAGAGARAHAGPGEARAQGAASGGEGDSEEGEEEGEEGGDEDAEAAYCFVLRATGGTAG